MEAIESIKKVLDQSFLEIKYLVFMIHNHNKCSSCGGKFLNISCKYCGIIDPMLDKMISELNIKLGKLEASLATFKLDKLPDNELFNLLMVLKDREIPMLDMLLEKYNYQENYYKQYESVLDKNQNNQQFSVVELSAIESMIYNSDEKINLLDLYNFFIRNAMIKGQNVSYDCFKFLIKKFSEKMMNAAYPNPECQIVENLKDGVVGGSFFKIMFLDELDVKNFYEGKSADLIFTIAHELQHTHQYKFIFSDLLFSPLIIDELKEFVLHEYNPEYYRQNHDSISFEKEAEIYGIADALNYLHGIGLCLADEERYLTYKQKLEEKLYDTERMMNGKVTTIDTEFEKVIANHPEALVKYKQLSMLYKVVDNKVISKTNEDLAKDLELVLANPNLDEDTRNGFRAFYQYYIGESRK